MTITIEHTKNNNYPLSNLDLKDGKAYEGDNGILYIGFIFSTGDCTVVGIDPLSGHYIEDYSELRFREVNIRITVE